VRFRWMLTALVGVSTFAVASIACSDGDNQPDDASEQPATDDSPDSSDGIGLGSVVPNTGVGEASEADIEGDLTVYRRTGDRLGVYV
jgi:hypothetical protein